MDLEEVANISSNDTDEYYDEPTIGFYERLFLELFTVLGLLSVIANIFIIFVILKFKKLRQDVTNIILVHLCVMESLYLLTAPLILRVSALFMFDHHLYVTIYCVFYQNEFVLTVAVCLFLFLLVCDWYIKTYSAEKYVKFTHVYKFFLAIVYIFIIFLSAVTTQMCYKGFMFVSTLLVMFATYTLLLIFVIVMNIVHAVKKKRLRESKPHVGLVIANMFFVFWIPLLLSVLLLYFDQLYSPELTIVACTLGFSSPVFNFYYLFGYEDNFNVFLKKVFKCQCNEYGNELLEEQTVSYSDINGVKIDRNQEQL